MVHGQWPMELLHAGPVKTMEGTQNKERKVFTARLAAEILHMHKS
jgi:hypothetical protein